MADIPSGKVGFFDVFKYAEFYDISSALLGACVGASAAYGLVDAGHKKTAILVIVLTVLLLVCLLLKGLFISKEIRKRHSLHDLEGCLHTLYAILIQVGTSNSSNSKLRITIHRPTKIKGNPRLLQVMDYVGDSRVENAAGRDFSINSGVIGLAYRSGEIARGRRANADYATYLKELIETWAYSAEDAKKVSPESKSWLAIPLSQKDQLTNKLIVDGIVYFDSIDPDFFDDSRVAAATAACTGIAIYIQRRYS